MRKPYADELDGPRPYADELASEEILAQEGREPSGGCFVVLLLLVLLFLLGDPPSPGKPGIVIERPTGPAEDSE